MQFPTKRPQINIVPLVVNSLLHNNSKMLLFKMLSWNYFVIFLMDFIISSLALALDINITPASCQHNPNPFLNLAGGDGETRKSIVLSCFHLLLCKSLKIPPHFFHFVRWHIRRAPLVFDKVERSARSGSASILPQTK